MKIDKLTKRAVDAAAAPPDGGSLFLWEGKTGGFGLRVTTGAKSYVFKYKFAGKTRTMTIGRHGDLTVDQARSAAVKLRLRVRKGEDPAADRRRLEEQRRQQESDTVDKLCDRYLERHARPNKKPTSVRNDESMIDKYIRPELGSMPIASVERRDALRLKNSIAKPYAANRVIALLSKMFALAEEWGLRDELSNPFRNIPKNRESGRERFLTDVELRRLGKVLGEVEAEGTELPSVVPAIRLLLFTGARLNEILTLEWKHVDEQRQCLNLPDSKTGKKSIVVGPAAMQLLAALPKEGDFVFPGKKAGSHLVNLRKPWLRIRERAKVPEVRIHDLRHSFASTAAATGASLPLIGALLGHRQSSTTNRYLHLVDDARMKVAADASAAIERAMRPKADGANVVPMKKRRAASRH